MNNPTKKLVLSALFAALACLLTMIIQIPAPTGYVNLGDCAVLLAGWVLGPLWGGAAAGVGSMLADVLNGWGAYAPATFLIKFVMAVLAAYVFRAMKGGRGRIVGAVAAEAIMVAGYFIYESLVLGVGPAAVASVPANLVQGAVSVAAGVAAALLLDRNGKLDRMR